MLDPRPVLRFALIGVDSKDNLYTGDVFASERVQRFVFK
jgi:hypothetical protein